MSIRAITTARVKTAKATWCKAGNQCTDFYGNAVLIHSIYGAKALVIDPKHGDRLIPIVNLKPLAQ